MAGVARAYITIHAIFNGQAMMVLSLEAPAVGPAASHSQRISFVWDSSAQNQCEAMGGATPCRHSHLDVDRIIYYGLHGLLPCCIKLLWTGALDRRVLCVVEWT